MREEFKIQRQGKTYVLYAGLLDEAHNRGLVSIDTELVQVPEEGNGSVAIVKAVVEIADPTGGEVKRFSGIGDAAPNNVSRSMSNALIRMGETRAKARALRDAVNVDATSLEELDDGDGNASTGSNRNSSSDSSSDNGSGRGSGGSRGQIHAVQDGQGTQAGQSVRSGSPEPPPPEEGDDGYGGAPIAGGRGGRAPKSQIDFIKTLAGEWRGERGVARLEQRIGKTLSELTRQEAESWIDKLTPRAGQDEGGAVSEASGESQEG